MQAKSPKLLRRCKCGSMDFKQLPDGGKAFIYTCRNCGRRGQPRAT